MNRLNGDAFKSQDIQKQGSDDEIDVGKLLVIARRNWRIVAVAAFVGLMLGVAQLATTTRLYTAQVDLSIGRSADVETFQDFSGTAGARIADVEIETELLVLRSERIAERVVRMLALHENRTFLSSRQSGLSRMVGFVRQQIGGVVAMVRSALSDDIPDLPVQELAQADMEARAIERAALRLRGGMSVNSVRSSRVLNIRYTSTSPELSARVANAVAQAYIEDQLEATDEASQRAIDWLRERRDQLREQSERVSEIAERFRAENNLLGVDIDRVADVEFERLTQNLVAARAELVELEARSRRLTEIVENEDTSAVVRETATQGITAGLRSRYLDVLRGYNNLATTLGDDHAQTQRRLRELQEIESLMFEEIRRSAQLVRDDLRATRERVASLETAQLSASERVGADQAVLSELRQLERNAVTVENLYASFQQRFQEATQRQEIPISHARVLNRARPPGGPSSPNARRILAFGGMLGLILSLGLVLFREWRDDRVRSEEQVREGLGLEYLGGLTLLKKGTLTASNRQLGTPAANKQIVHLPEVLTFSADKPLSNFAETLRTGKMSLTLRHGQTARAPRVGFVSCFPGEGKTTTAANFANLLAQQGARVVLVDGDMRNPGLSRSLSKRFDAGLVDVLMGEKDWHEVVHVAQETGLHIIPNSKVRAVHTSELMGSRAMAMFLDQLDQEYDYVVLDLPPLAPVVDARAVLEKLDGVFFVLKWGGTHLDMAKRVLRIDPRLRDKCYGAFLNMYDPKKARAYEGYQSYRYYQSFYKNYYHDT